jgi:hypothetical protein
MSEGSFLELGLSETRFPGIRALGSVVNRAKRSKSAPGENRPCACNRLQAELKRSTLLPILLLFYLLLGSLEAHGA